MRPSSSKPLTPSSLYNTQICICSRSPHPLCNHGPHPPRLTRPRLRGLGPARVRFFVRRQRHARLLWLCRLWLCFDIGGPEQRWPADAHADGLRPGPVPHGLCPDREWTRLTRPGQQCPRPHDGDAIGGSKPGLCKNIFNCNIFQSCSKNNLLAELPSTNNLLPILTANDIIFHQSKIFDKSFHSAFFQLPTTVLVCRTRPRSSSSSTGSS
jgi:hypothetical protein